MKKFLCLLFLAFGLNAQANEATNLLVKLQEKFDSIETIASDFNQAFALESGEQTSGINGKFYYKRVGHFRIELSKQVLISNGKSVWNYTKEKKRVVVSNIEDDPSSVSLDKIVNEYPKNCDVKLLQKNSEGGFVLEFIPLNGKINFQSAKLFVGSDFIIDQIEIVDFNNMKMRFTLSTTKINSPIDDSNFLFTPTEGIKVIDLR